MKPWLLNILACPIDKHHPLEAHFFRWETTPEAMKALAAGHVESGERLSLLRKQIREGVISPPSLDAVRDVTGLADADVLRKRAVEALGSREPSDGELGAASAYLNWVEVAEGLLVCPECGRWYPVGCSVESVPELMPDELREEEKELAWMGKWSGVVPESVRRSGLPFRP